MFAIQDSAGKTLPAWDHLDSVYPRFLGKQALINLADKGDEPLVDGQHPAPVPTRQDDVEQVVDWVVVANGGGQGFGGERFVRLESVHQADGLGVASQGRVFAQIAATDIFPERVGDFTMKQSGRDDQTALSESLAEGRRKISAQNDIGRR